MLPMPASWEVQDKLSPPQLDLRSGFSRGKRLRERIGLCQDGGAPTCLCLSCPHSHCCRQGLRAGDALCWAAGSGHGARLREPRDGSKEEPGTSASPATPATGVTSPPCWPPETSCLLHPANQAASGACTEGGKAPTGMGVCGAAQSREGLGMVPGELGGSRSHRWAGCRRQPWLWWEQDVFVHMDMCVSAHLRRGSQAGECVTTIWGRPRGPARAEQASPG